MLLSQAGLACIILFCVVGFASYIEVREISTNLSSFSRFARIAAEVDVWSNGAPRSQELVRLSIRIHEIRL